MKVDKRVLLFLSSAVPLVAVTSSFTHLLSSSRTSATTATNFRPTQRLMFQGNHNPLEMVGNLFSSKSSSPPSLEMAKVVQEKLDVAPLPSWKELRSHLESKVTTPEERDFRVNLAKGYGVGSPLHKIRLYDESNRPEDIRVTFYRDSASWCPYCQKVWLTLEEKKIPYSVEKINMRCYGEKTASFQRLQPSGAIPVATIDGNTLRQSNDILFALEDLFPEHKSMMPSDERLSNKAQEFLRLERQIFSAWMYWLTGGGSQAKKTFLETLQVVEKALTEVEGGHFFMGSDITIVDAQFVPFLERMAASLLYYKGFQLRVAPGEKTDYPNINAWFDAMETLPSYQMTKSDYYTHCWDLPPQLSGCLSEPGGEIYEKVINGVKSMDGRPKGSWELPLQPHNGGVEPDWDFAGDEAAARREAVERVSGNYEAIVKFAARGAGTKGSPGYGAPLSDPNAIPNEDIQPAVDHMIRLVCLAILDGTEAHQKELEKSACVIAETGGKEFTQALVKSLSYMRDRVGVPRDMRFPAARQLRAHLNWAIGGILDQHNM